MFDKYFLKTVLLIAAATTLCGALTNSASAQEADPLEILDRMAAEVGGLEKFILTGDAYSDARLPAGQIIQNSSVVTMRVRKPDAMHMSRRDTEGMMELFIGSGELTFYNDSEGFYAQTDVPGGIGPAVVNEVGIDAPLLDFVSQDMADTMLEDAQQVDYIGTSLVRGVLHHQIAIRTAEVDIQMWVASEGPPLPGKMLISSKWEAGSPRFVVFMNWNTAPDFPDKPFKFVPPAGATKIDFLPIP
jgi:hypothetical protein